MAFGDEGSGENDLKESSGNPELIRALPPPPPRANDGDDDDDCVDESLIERSAQATAENLFGIDVAGRNASYSVGIGMRIEEGLSRDSGIEQERSVIVVDADEGASGGDVVLSGSSRRGMDRSGSLPPRVMARQKSVRSGKVDHVQLLALNRRASVLYIEQNLGLQKGQLVHAISSFADSETSEGSVPQLKSSMLGAAEKAKLEAEKNVMKGVMASLQDFEDLGIVTNEIARSVEVRMRGFNYVVPVNEDDSSIHTILSSSNVYKIYNKAREIKAKRGKGPDGLKLTRAWSLRNAEGSSDRRVLKDVDLVFTPGYMYLVLGPPGSGKTTLLRAISSLLPIGKNGPKVKGSVTYNGIGIDNDAGVVLPNAIAFIDQIDRHAPRLTVEETLDFAFQCKGGTHRSPIMEGDPDKIEQIVTKRDKEGFRVNITMQTLGLDHVRDTFVGSTEVRGVSGGQRRRVTIGEMLMWSAPVLCGDEISTGLDAASTYDIVNILGRLTKIHNYTRVVSLLQPSPETFSAFDDVVILSEGHVIFAGPILDAVPYFHGLGYEVPEHMDDADFLQALATPDGEDFYVGPGSCPDPAALAALFKESAHGEKIRERLDAPLKYDWTDGAKFTVGCNCDDVEVEAETDVEVESGYRDGSGHNTLAKQCRKGRVLFKERFQTSFWRATMLNARRFFVLWKRDTRFVRANFIKNVVMGVSVGLVFLQTTIVESILGVLFQSMLFIMLGAMTAAPAQINDRAIFYKHRDANLYPAWAYVLGRTIAGFPQAVMDVTTFGTIIYFVVGLELAASNFFIFYAILLVFTFVMSTMLAACAAVLPSKSTVQATSAVIILFNMLFCGFFVSPIAIPVYYRWIYWICPLAWAYRGLVCNQFLSPSYSQATDDTGLTEGEIILEFSGFTRNGESFTRAWIGYSFIYMVSYCILMLALTTAGLTFVRYEAGISKRAEGKEEGKDDTMENESFDLPFKPIDLTFKDICYEVKASTSNEKLRLLNKVNGRLRPGRMCALMGSSGAGKTTLMDVIALRKHSGTITGEVRLNGHLQEEVTFRRCSGYVEQFDVQTPELTVMETVLFSANLRLDVRNIPMLEDKQNVIKYVDQVLDMMELTHLKNVLVGDDESGGLTFEQRKRLSIAVELAASPSVIFLDEPTSGLDSRAALIVVKSLRKIASTGRTVCATIHQPSSAVFEMFDDLLLMKKGGRVVFCGELGKNSSELVAYLESHGGTFLNRGENPATWMLNVITKEPVGDEDPDDFAQLYLESGERRELVKAINEVTKSARDEDKITYETTYAATVRTRHYLVKKRLELIYWRSPSYNRSRVILSLVIAFLLASVFLNNRRPDIMSEQEISGVFATIFLSFIIVGILSLTSVLPVMLKIRDVFYRHKAAGMMNHNSIVIALAAAEQPFILISSTCFCAVFYFTLGLELSLSKFVAFWGFFTFNVGINSYFGQSFMCLVGGLSTAGILCSVLIGMNNFFSGLIVRPQYLNGFWQAPYWITPGRYVYEGLMASQFHDDDRTVIADPGTSFYEYLISEGQCEDTIPECQGTVSQFFNVFFGGRFRRGNVGVNGLVLGFLLVLARLLTYFALQMLNYASS